MNWLDFLVFGPASLWFLGCALVFLAISSLITNKTNKGIIIELQSITRALTSELERITKELRQDTKQLHDSTSGLNQELSLLRKSTEALHKTLQRFYNFWFPYNEID